VTAVVCVPDEANARELVVRSPALRIRVAHPVDIDEEREAVDLFDPEVGTYLAFAGTAALPRARDRLRAICDRRKSVSDPIVAATVRAEGIDAGRSYLRFDGDRLREVPGDVDRSAELLNSLGDVGLAAFDDSTAHETRTLANERSAAVARLSS
jgi:hypothetical protein